MNKNILHITHSFFPNRGWSETLIVPILKNHTNSYNTYLITLSTEDSFIQYEGINVYTIKYQDNISLIYEKFLNILNEIKPNLILFHCYNILAEINLVHTIRNSYKNIRILFMYHHPSVTCLRGDLIQYGEKVCDGKVAPNKCTSCFAHYLGLPKILSQSLAYMPSTKKKIKGIPNVINTIITLKSSVENTIKNKIIFYKSLDYIITLNEWSKKQLVLNDIALENIITIPIALPISNIEEDNLPIPTPTIQEANYLKLIYVGRLSKEKGVHNVIQAISQLNDQCKILFDVYGVYGNDTKYNDYLTKTIEKVDGVFYKGILNDKLVVKTMMQYDIVIVSSITSETGPLTVLEGFAAHKFVLGTNVNGINEMIEDGKNGYLVNFNDVNDWKNKILKIYRDKTFYTNKEISLPQKRIFLNFINELNNFINKII